MFGKTSVKKLAVAGVLASALLLAVPLLPVAHAETIRKTFPMQISFPPGGLSLYSLHSFATTEGNAYSGESSDSAFGQTVKHKSWISTYYNHVIASTELPTRLYGANVYTLQDIYIKVTDMNGGVQTYHFDCPSGNNSKTLTIPNQNGNVYVEIRSVYATGWFCY